jgi:Short repeat of unknown function (DUF308)
MSDQGGRPIAQEEGNAMANTTGVKTPTGPAYVQPTSGWHIVWGVLLIAAGVLAVLMPVVAALATGLVFGWLLVLGGGCGRLAAELDRVHRSADRLCAHIDRSVAHRPAPTRRPLNFNLSRRNRLARAVRRNGR